MAATRIPLLQPERLRQSRLGFIALALRTPFEETHMNKKHLSNDVSIGKFDILATYTYAKELLDGYDDDAAKQRGMVAAIMGAQARLGIRKDDQDEFQAQKEAAETKKKTTITAESFDRQVAAKMGAFFDEAFLPGLNKLVEAGLSYDEVKRLLKIPSTWGAKMSGEQFRERVAKYVSNG
jgi:hypothetical protein